MKALTTQENTTNIGRNIAYFLIGGTVGAAAALLLAPKSGSELRGDIAETARHGYDGAVDLANRVKDESASFYHSVLDKKDNLLNLAGDAFSETKDRVSDAVEAGKEKAQDVRDAAETKLESVQNRSGHQGRRSSNVV